MSSPDSHPWQSCARCRRVLLSQGWAPPGGDVGKAPPPLNPWGAGRCTSGLPTALLALLLAPAPRDEETWRED